MKIDAHILKNINFPADSKYFELNFFSVSKNSLSLKKLDINALSQEKLRKLTEELRVVAVIQIGETTFAYVNKYAKVLENQQDLSIDGKRVSVKTLTEKEYEELYALLLAEADAEKKGKEDGAKKFSANHPLTQEQSGKLLVQKNLKTDWKPIDTLIFKIKNIEHNIILKLLRKFNEDRRELEKQKQQDEKLDKIKKESIKHDIRNKEMLNNIIKNDELNRSQG